MDNMRKNLQRLEIERKKDIANSVNRNKETLYLSELYGTEDILNKNKTYDGVLDEFLTLANELKQLDYYDRDCNKLGRLGELATFIYYIIYKRYDYLNAPTSADMYFIQEHYGDYFIHDYEKEAIFTVDSKTSTTWDFIPRLGISLSHWDKDNNPYNGKVVKKKTNFSWLYYLDCCHKINAFNVDLFQFFIIEDLQSVREILLSEYVTKKGNVIDDNLDILNSKFRYDALVKRPPRYDNEGTDKEVRTELLSLALTDEVINYLGSKLIIVQFEEKREPFTKSDLNELLNPNSKKYKNNRYNDSKLPF